MLPLLFGLGGSALAGAGMLGGMGALTAGAIGSGLGSYLQTGDLGQGIQTGLLSYLGGKALGSAFGGGADVAAGTGGANPADIQAAAGGAGAMSNQAAIDAANAATKAKLGADTGLAGATTALKTPEVLGALGTTGALGLMDQGGEFGTTPYKDIPEAKKFERETVKPPEDFRPGIDGEFNYFKPYSLSAPGFQEGGLTDLAKNPMDVMGGAETPEMIPNDKEIINDAVDAIKGKDPQPEMALGRFLSRYGEDALKDLVQRVQSGEFDRNAEVEEGKVNGAGDGMDDLIPAKLDGEDDVVLSDGEFIVPADVVSGLGNGSSDAGSKALYDMMDRVREMRTGKKEQPKQVPQGEMLPV